jgi:plasmid stabilization system protein ParE
MVRLIKWDKKAADNLIAAITFIGRDSIQNAEKVKKGLLSKINDLKTRPEKYPLDKYKKGNQGIFRAFELHHYRVSYAVLDEEIIITQIRHTSMEPIEY